MRLHSLSSFVTLSSVLFGYLCVTDVAIPAEFGDVELSGYVLGGWPRDRDIFSQETIVPASVQQGFGAGLTVGLFPAALHGIMGVAFDSNIHGGALSFPNIAKGQAHGTGHSDLLVTNTTANLILRYPGTHVRP